MEWIKWTKTCGRRFEEVEISEEQAKLIGNVDENGGYNNGNHVNHQMFPSGYSA